MQDSKKIRIGYVNGNPKRLNERVIDKQWVSYLGRYSELIPIPPLQVIKWFGAKMNTWSEDFTQSLSQLSASLKAFTEKYQINSMYMNMPFQLPYLMMARSYAGLDLGFLFLSHSVGSEAWMRQWIAIAPVLSERDVMLVNTQSSKQALLRISPSFQLAQHIPLCMDMQDLKEGIRSLIEGRSGKRLLSIGRLEDVKNIDILLKLFHTLLKHIPDLHLTIAGEYTGADSVQAADYKLKLGSIMEQYQLDQSVTFSGPVDGEAKVQLFRQCDILINLSTDPGETFGYNLLEAKNWGIPVICTNWNGFREVVSHGVDGFLINCTWVWDQPEIDIEQAVHFTLRLLQSDELRRSFAQNAFSNAKAFDVNQVFPRIIRALIQSKASAPIEAAPWVSTIYKARLCEHAELYHLEALQSLPFYEHSLLSIVTGESNSALEAWMPKSKPIIKHFAGRNEYAKH